MTDFQILHAAQDALINALFYTHEALKYADPNSADAVKARVMAEQETARATRNLKIIGKPL